MPRAESKLPGEVLLARADYIAVKRAHGVCIHLTCNCLAEPGRSRCARCLTRVSAGQRRYTKRQKENGNV